MTAYEITGFCVLRIEPLSTAYGLKNPEYCVPKTKRGFHPHIGQFEGNFKLLSREQGITHGW